MEAERLGAERLRAEKLPGSLSRWSLQLEAERLGALETLRGS